MSVESTWLAGPPGSSGPGTAAAADSALISAVVTRWLSGGAARLSHGSIWSMVGYSVSVPIPRTSGDCASTLDMPKSEVAASGAACGAVCTAIHRQRSTAVPTSSGWKPGALGSAASTTSSYGSAAASSRPAASSTRRYSSSKIGSVGSLAPALTTAVTVIGSTVTSLPTLNGTLPAVTCVPWLTAGGSPVAWPASKATRPVALRGGYGGTCSRCSSHRRVWSGIWLKRNSRLSPRWARSSSRVMPGSLGA